MEENENKYNIIGENQKSNLKKVICIVVLIALAAYIGYKYYEENYAEREFDEYDDIGFYNYEDEEDDSYWYEDEYYNNDDDEYSIYSQYDGEDFYYDGESFLDDITVKEARSYEENYAKFLQIKSNIKCELLKAGNDEFSSILKITNENDIEARELNINVIFYDDAHNIIRVMQTYSDIGPKKSSYEMIDGVPKKYATVEFVVDTDEECLYQTDDILFDDFTKEDYDKVNVSYSKKDKDIRIENNLDKDIMVGVNIEYFYKGQLVYADYTFKDVEANDVLEEKMNINYNPKYCDDIKVEIMSIEESYDYQDYGSNVIEMFANDIESEEDGI